MMWLSGTVHRLDCQTSHSPSRSHHLPSVCGKSLVPGRVQNVLCRRLRSNRYNDEVCMRERGSDRKWKKGGSRSITSYSITLTLFFFIFSFACPVFHSLSPSSYQPLVCSLDKIFPRRYHGNRPIQSRAPHCVWKRWEKRRGTGNAQNNTLYALY